MTYSPKPLGFLLNTFNVFELQRLSDYPVKKRLSVLDMIIYEENLTTIVYIVETFYILHHYICFNYAFIVS